MEHLKPKIEFYRRRSFSEKMNVTFEFIRENWKPLLKFSFYLIMPVCLIQTFAMNSFITVYFDALTHAGGNNPFGNSMISFLGNYGVLMCCILTGTGLLSGMTYALMQTYAVRENRLQDVILNDFKELLVKNTWKYIRLILAFIALFCLIGILMGFLVAVVSVWSLAVTIPLCFALLLCMLPLMMLVPVYIFERHITFFAAIRKAWKLGVATFGGMLGLMIVLYFISSVIQTVTMLPWYILWIVGTVFSLASESMMSQSVIYKFVLYIFGLLQSYGMYVSMMIGIIGLAFQYFHAREKVEGVTIESNISNFSNL